ncbi:MAG TPA: hypothetical protein VNN55_03355 [bacterium]|nr:hypothetical protein [bacterium]
MAVSGIWIVIPSWLYAVAVSLLGRLGQGRWLSHRTVDEAPHPHWWPGDWGNLLITNLVFLSIIPISLLSVIDVILPFTGARAGLALGLLAFVFGATPLRLLDASEQGWDRTLWSLLIDLLRIGGAMTIVGALVSRV